MNPYSRPYIVTLIGRPLYESIVLVDLYRQGHAIVLDGDPTILLVDVDLWLEDKTAGCRGLGFRVWGLGV